MELIPIDSYLANFKQHLEINERAILSAKFGDGKTHFLNKFKEKYQSDYFFITLYPVNYSVADNADIFEYIKRDIILQLSQEDEVLLNVDFTAIADSIFSWENAREVISFLISSIPGGIFYDKLLKKVEKFYEEYEKKKQTYEKYLKTFEIQKGGIYEHDAYTLIIEKAIEYIQKTERKVILIIEDLDRIDPEHLFRILNVLGAHIDCKFQHKKSCNPNKFGIDYIVTVFDYELAEHLFYHFYGEKTNYEGYISKFKVRQPFFYSINQIAIDFLFTYIEQNCYIERAFLEDCKDGISAKIYSKLNSLSIREITYVLSNLDNQINSQIIKGVSSEIKYSTITPATRFFSILKRIGIKEDEIKAFVKGSSKTDKYLNMVGPFLCNHSIFCTQSSIGYNKTYFDIIKKTDNGVIISMTFERSEYSVSFPHKEIIEAINSGVDIAIKYIYD